MKKPTSLLLVSLVILCSSFLNAAQGTSPAAPKEPSAVTPGSQASVAPKQAITAQAERSEKEMLVAINAKLERLENRVAAIENAQRDQFAALRDGVQVAFNQVGEEIGNIQMSIAQLEKATKAVTTPADEKPRKP